MSTPSEPFTVLIDCDIHRYQHGSIEMPHPFAGHGEIPDDAMVPASADHIRYMVDQTIEETIRATGATDYICALSGKGNFRFDIAKQQPYKGNRDPKLKRPYHYDTVGDHIISTHPHHIVDGIEADDWLGITQRSDPGRYCIASRDKDLKTVHGWHYRFACGKSQPAVPMHWMSEYEATNFFFYQMLIGDNTDNIPGCGIRELRKWGTTTEIDADGKEVKVPKMVLRRKGVGSQEALDTLEDCLTNQDMYEAVHAKYVEVFEEKADEVMLEMARLLYIGQKPDNLFEWSWLGISTEPVNVEVSNSSGDI